MRHGIKTHGIIYVGRDSRAVVKRVFDAHGQFRCAGELVNGGWAVALEPVNEEVLSLLAEDYEIVDCDEGS